MTKTILAWVRFAFTMPWTLISWFLCILLCLLQFAELTKLRFRDTGVLSTSWKPWIAKLYPYTLTLGRVRIYKPGHEGIVDDHESVHVAQVEDLMLLSFFIGLIVILCTGDSLLGFILWTSGGTWQLPNFLTAMLRYGHRVKWTTEGSFGTRLKLFLGALFLEVAYRDSEHERSAYAQTDIGSDGLSWASRQEQSKGD